MGKYDPPEQYKRDKDGKITHTLFKNPRNGEPDYLPVDEPSGADYLVEQVKYGGWNSPEIKKAREAAQKRRDEK